MNLSDKMFNPDIRSMEENRDINGLIKALNHDEYLIRKEATRSLKKVGDERAIEPLIKSLKYEEWQVQHALLNTVRVFSGNSLHNQ